MENLILLEILVDYETTYASGIFGWNLKLRNCAQSVMRSDMDALLISNVLFDIRRKPSVSGQNENSLYGHTE